MRTYAHGILYSVLERPLMCEEARRHGLSSLLDAVKNHSPEPFASQIQHILNRVRSMRVHNHEASSDSI